MLEGLADRIESICENFVGPLMVDDAKILVSIPYPPASFPGQPPHLRSGLLQSLMAFEVARPEPLIVEVTLYNDAPYADRLMAMDRDFLTPVVDHWLTQAVEVIQEILVQD